MSFDAYTHFTALLALLAASLLVVGTGVVLAAAYTDRADAAARWLRQALSESGLWVAAIVAIASTAGSLYYSEHFDLEPCQLCWFQRIAMYPLVLMLPIAAYRRDWRHAFRYGLPLAVLGALVSAYHYLIQLFPDLDAATCSLGVPCTARYVERYGFVSIPLMALSGFLLIGAILASGRFARDRAGTP